MELEAAVNLANRLLMTAAEFDSATGGVRPENGCFGTVRILTPEGIETLAEERQADFWKA